MKHKPLIRHTRSSDIKPLLELQERVYPTIQPWPESTLLQQIETFPQGQIVAEVDGHLVGAASSLMILWDEWDVEHTWKEITSRGSFNTHNPEGRTLYGAEVFVQPELRGAGIGHALYRGLLWSLVVLIPTLFLGRFFCGWVCPMGTLHHFFGSLKSESKRGKQLIERARIGNLAGPTVDDYFHP